MFMFFVYIYCALLKVAAVNRPVSECLFVDGFDSVSNVQLMHISALQPLPWQQV